MKRTTPVRGMRRVRTASLALALAAGPIAAGARGADDNGKADATGAQASQQDRQSQQAQEQERAAAALLSEAKQAYEQKNHEAAAAKYREFLRRFAKRPEALAAQYGLGITLAEMPDRDWNAVTAALSPVVTADGVTDKGRAHFWLGMGLRVTGEQQFAAIDRPAEQAEAVAKARKRIADAAVQLAAAERALSAAAAKSDAVAADAKELPPTMEMAARAKVEAADALCRIGKHREAAELSKVFTSDPTWKRSREHVAGLVALGEALAGTGDYPNAFAALAQVAPFGDQLALGLRAKYLLGRILQETGERPEAVEQFQWVAATYPAQRKKAEEILRDKERLRDRPVDRVRLESFVRRIPEYVAQAQYRAATIQFEYGQFADAAAKYDEFLKAAPRSELAPIAQLRQGIAHVQAKQAPAAMRALQPLAESPALGDQATWWIGRLQRASVDPTNRAQLLHQTQAAITTLGRAAEKASARGKTDPAAAARHGDILLDIADAYAALRQYREAAPIYEQLAADASNPGRAEVAHERWAMTLCKLGKAEDGDAACKAFLEKYPASMARPSVMFWQAENSYRRGADLARQSDSTTPAVAGQIKKLQEQAAAQYAAVVDKYPEFPQASQARYGLGMSYYRQGVYEKAVKHLAKVLDVERVGEMATTSYYQADCLYRTLPENADDALSAARLASQLEEAAKLLSSFVGAGDRPETPDALLKLADCYQRQAAILADAQEKAKAWQGARETYDKLLQNYPRHSAYASAVMERARTIAAMGDAGGAINELNRFRNDGRLAKSDVAPLAFTRLSELMVRNGRAVDAAAMMEKARHEYEPQLAGDAKRSAWIPGLRYQHGMALKESGKTKEALALLEAVVKEFADRPEAAEASLALILVRKDEALGKLKAARDGVAAVPADRAVDAKLAQAQADAVKGVADIAGALAEHAGRLAESAAGSDLHVRTLRDAGDAWRAVAAVEIADARRAKAAESLKRLKDKAAKEATAGKSNSAPRPPLVSLAAIPVTPAEQKARECYEKVLDAAPDSAVCNALRLEMAQMHTDRGEAEAAIQLLTAALDKNPPPDQAQQLRVKLGNAYLLKKDSKGAMQQALAALEETNSPARPAAYLVKGRAQMLAKDWPNAITTLSRYRNGAEKYVQAGPVTEEGLMRLAEAYAATNQWEQSRATCEHLLKRFPQGKWATESKFGIGHALQKARQYDRAVAAYQDVVRQTSSEYAARAQMQIGLCRAEQKRLTEAVNELLIVPDTYDYADVSANASLEAGKALVELKQPARAKDVLEGVVRDHPGTAWAAQAQERLARVQASN